MKNKLIYLVNISQINKFYGEVYGLYMDRFILFFIYSIYLHKTRSSITLYRKRVAIQTTLEKDVKYYKIQNPYYFMYMLFVKQN